jgi:hypothetical protein
MSTLDKLLKRGLKVMNESSARQLTALEKVKSLKVSSRGRLSVPKIVMETYGFSKFTHFLPLLQDEPRELWLYLLDENELRERHELKIGPKKILFYQAPSSSSPDNSSTAYFEIGPQLKHLKVIDGTKKGTGFMLNFRIEEDNKVLVLELDKKF